MSCQGTVSPKGARKLHDADVVYLYDGSFEGFLCCVYESFAQHELPFAVWTPQRETATLYPVKDIATANMDVFDTAVLAKSLTSYKNILETLNGTMVGGNADGIFSPGRRTRSCCCSAFCIWPLRWVRARSSGRGIRWSRPSTP